MNNNVENKLLEYAEREYEYCFSVNNSIITRSSIAISILTGIVFASVRDYINGSLNKYCLVLFGKYTINPLIPMAVIAVFAMIALIVLIIPGKWFPSLELEALKSDIYSANGHINTKDYINLHLIMIKRMNIVLLCKMWIYYIAILLIVFFIIYYLWFAISI